MSSKHTSTGPARTGKQDASVKPATTPRQIVQGVALKSRVTAKKIREANTSGGGRARLF